jgi:dihydroflavonol-4-reductase
MRVRGRETHEEVVVRALVLGASGHIGNAITRALIDRGYEVTAAGRRISLPINLAGLAIKYVQGDLDFPGQIERWIEGHDVVIDAAAPYPSRLMPHGESAAAALEQAGRRTRMLIDAVRRQQARLAYVSTFATLGDCSTGFDRIQREWIRRLHPYFAVKERIEGEIRAAARTGLTAVIVNPTLCIGPWDIKARDLCFVPRLLGGEAPVSVAHSINVIDVRDVAAGLVTALERERWGEPILLAGHNISVEALYTWICEIGGVMPPRIVAPITLGMIATYWSELALGAIGLAPPLPALAPMLTMLHDSFEPSRIQSELGIVPRSLSGTLRDAIDWYRQIGYC